MSKTSLRDSILGILVGLAAVSAIAALRSLLGGAVGAEMPLLLFTIAVLAAAATGGVWAGIVTTAVSLAVGTYLFVGLTPLSTSPVEWIRAVSFVIIGVAISVVLEMLRRRTRQLEEATEELSANQQIIARMAMEDQLTGLGNRRLFETALRSALSSVPREHSPVSLLIMDVDGLKRINDTFGHERGDELLRAVGSVLTERFRGGDTAYRVGGDEFAVILPGAGATEAAHIVARVVTAFAQIGPQFEGAGVSVGCASAPDDGADSLALVRTADSRMYEAKAARNSARI